jgi:hypothetical protein
MDGTRFSWRCARLGQWASKRHLGGLFLCTKLPRLFFAAAFELAGLAENARGNVIYVSDANGDGSGQAATSRESATLGFSSQTIFFTEGQTPAIVTRHCL